MDKLVIEGGKNAGGRRAYTVRKNAVLPILAATVLNSGKNVIHGCPDLKDVRSSINILRHLGCGVHREGDTLIVDSAGITNCEIPEG